jgi:hypothetical protein
MFGFCRFVLACYGCRQHTLCGCCTVDKKGSHYTKVIVSGQGNQSEFTQVAPISLVLIDRDENKKSIMVV